MYTFTSRIMMLSTFVVLAMSAKPAAAENNNYFYSTAGREHAVSFQSVYRSETLGLNDIKTMTSESKKSVITYEILPVMDFLFGPLVNRELGSPQRATEVLVDWDKAQLVNGKVELPYTYKGLWIVAEKVSILGKLSLPVPLNKQVVFTPKWKSCTDSARDHQTPGFYWYFWDPTRWGCDQTDGVEYRTVEVQMGAMTQQTAKTFPEYQRMIINGEQKMTFAFGYVTDPAVFSPETDIDEGARQYQAFVTSFRGSYGHLLTDSPILQKEYQGSYQPELVIGHRFTGIVNGNNVTVNIMMAAGVDQMDLFAKSFAHDHDSFFGWFGHSRVGSGFDAERFGQMVRSQPNYFSITSNYQVIYWAGCNSYSYYTVPFFEFKGGTKNLDIIANGLPSYFSLNAINAQITADAFLNWPNRRTSYQSMVKTLETRAKQFGALVLVVALGDEDNQ
jgi:hypothetical protein